MKFFTTITARDLRLWTCIESNNNGVFFSTKKMCILFKNMQYSNTLQDAHPTRASLWRRGMDIIKH